MAEHLLFTPFVVADIELANRVVMPPMGTGLPDRAGTANEDTVAYYRRRAAGGVGLICVEASLVSPGTTAIGPELQLHNDRFLPGLRAIAEAVHAEAVPVGIQLWHPGRQTILGEPVGPSAVPLSSRAPLPRALTLDDIGEIVADYGTAAARCREAGFDFVEIHAAHCYLPCEFLSPLSNIREDEYGGSLSNRTRFLLEIVAEIRARCGSDYPIFCRLTGGDGVPGGFTIDDASVVAPWLVQAGVACLSVSAGSWHALHLTIPPMSMAPGCLVPYAERIKAAVDVPVIAAGRLDDPELAEQVLAEQRADLIAVGRGLIADADWVNKARDGRAREIRPCLSCNACVELLSRGERARCAVNPEVTREATWKVLQAAHPRRVMVIGSGPAGMEAARMARTRGHDVSIWEQAGTLGGKLDVASRAPSKAVVLKFRDYQARSLRDLGVDIRTGVRVTAADVRRADPDVVVVATGADALVPSIPGIDGINVVDAQQILLGEVEIAGGERVAIVGGSATGCETAEYLVGTASEISILEMEPQVGNGIELITRRLLIERLVADGVALLTGAKVINIDSGYVTYERADETTAGLAVDRIALAVGWRPRGPELAQTIGDRELVAIGDAVRPADFVAAVSAGAEAGLAL